MNTFAPHLDVLPAAQRRLWPELAPAAALGHVLYGGTAVALRLGHRASVDFDFFSAAVLDRAALRTALPFVARSLVLQDAPDAWTMLVPVKGGEVKVSFFGGLTFGRVGEPERTEDGVVLAASLLDLLATKVKVVLQRAEAKDYRDVARLLKAGGDLAQGLGAARALFGPAFQPSESLRALCYFGDGDLATLPEADRSALVAAVKAVRGLPEVQVLSRDLAVGRERGGGGPAVER